MERLSLCWAGGTDQAPLSFQGEVKQELPLFHPCFPAASLGSPRPHQVIVFGLIFCWVLAVSGRRGRERKGRRNRSVSTIPAPLLLPLLGPAATLFWKNPASGDSGAQTCRWDHLPWGNNSQQVWNRPFSSPFLLPSISRRALSSSILAVTLWCWEIELQEESSTPGAFSTSSPNR